MSYDPFIVPRKHIQWARSRIQIGTQAFHSFASQGVFELVVETDPKNGDEVHKFKQVRALPHEVEMYLADALNHLRNSFDQSLYAACLAIERPVTTLNYPWANNPPDLEARMAGGKKKEAVPAELRDEIRRQQPYRTGQGYPGGNDLVRNVAALVNRKHDVGFAASPVVSAMAVNEITAMGGGSVSLGDWDPVTGEAVFARVGRGGWLEYDKPQIEVALNFKDASLSGIPAFAAIRAFYKKAESSLTGFVFACMKVNHS